ncbi:MAG: galactose mutarotase [Oscillospiraceae bacterium]|nr:galactose mutarotase [Oscillospiraceae bacterium]
MSIVKSGFGRLADGREIDKYLLTGAGGLSVSLITYGAAIQQLIFADTDLVLGFDTLEGYVAGNSYQGATIGRYANRIAEGRFPLNGKTIQVGYNEKGRGCLHGGIEGFESKVWEAAIISDGDEPSMVFTYLSPDGEEGFPGNLDTAVTFTVTADNILRIAYTAATDADTVCSLTNHAYFNLGGYASGDILDTVLTIRGDAVTPVSEKMCPTGEIRPVDGTIFDFRTSKPIGQDVFADDEQIKIGNGYDVNYVLSDSGFRQAVTARSPKSGIKMTISTDLPATQFYAGGTLSEKQGKGGNPLCRFQGFCFETQFYPDAPNQPHFPSPLLRAGERFRSVTEYKFEK